MNDLAPPPRPASVRLCPECGKPGFGFLGVANQLGVSYCHEHAPGWSEEMREEFRKVLRSPR